MARGQNIEPAGVYIPLKWVILLAVLILGFQPATNYIQEWRAKHQEEQEIALKAQIESVVSAQLTTLSMPTQTSVPSEEIKKYEARIAELEKANKANTARILELEDRNSKLSTRVLSLAQAAERGILSPTQEQQ